MKSTITVAIILGALVGVGGRLALRGDSQTRRTRPVQTTEVTLVCANGWVEGARPNGELRAETSGRLTAIHVDEGDAIAKGMVVAELENSLQKARVEQTRAELAAAKQALQRLLNGERVETRDAARAEEAVRRSAYEGADREYRRLNRAGIGVSASEIDQARTKQEQTLGDWERAKAQLKLVEAPARSEDVKEQEAKVSLAEARQREAEAELARTQIRSPIDGQVLERRGEVGAMAGPTGEPLFVVADLSRRRVRGFVEELDEARVKAGQGVQIRADSRTGEVFSGRVARVLPAMTKKNGPRTDAANEMKDLHYREVLIDLDGTSELPPGLLVQIRINTGSSELP